MCEKHIFLINIIKKKHLKSKYYLNNLYFFRNM